MKQTKNKALGGSNDPDKEKEIMFSNADKIKGEQLIIIPDGVKMEDELKKFALGNIDNPEKKYELLYKGIMKLLKAYLPKGERNKKARDYIYEEKNTFLTRGHRKNNDGIRGLIAAWLISRNMKNSYK